jgi:hypothetical protein
MKLLRAGWIHRFAAALLIGLAFPYAELAWRCREPFRASEACVWGRAYLPLSRVLEPLLISPVLFLVFTIVAHVWRSRINRMPRE